MKINWALSHGVNGGSGFLRLTAVTVAAVAIAWAVPAVCPDDCQQRRGNGIIIKAHTHNASHR